MSAFALRVEVPHVKRERRQTSWAGWFAETAMAVIAVLRGNRLWRAARRMVGAARPQRWIDQGLFDLRNTTLAQPRLHPVVETQNVRPIADSPIPVGAVIFLPRLERAVKLTAKNLVYSFKWFAIAHADSKSDQMDAARNRAFSLVQACRPSQFNFWRFNHA